ncbi:MAG: GNAT family N-acetyltransferase [bacterium]
MDFNHGGGEGFRVREIRREGELEPYGAAILTELGAYVRSIEILPFEPEKELKRLLSRPRGGVFVFLEHDRMSACLIMKSMTWDSKAYGMKMSSIRLLFAEGGGSGARRLKTDVLEFAKKNSAGEGVKYILFPVSGDDDTGAGAASEAGFEPIAGMVNLRHSLETAPPRPAPAGVKIRGLKLRETAEIEDITSEAFVYDRYNVDPRLPARGTDRIHRDWARQCCRFCEHVLVAERDGAVAGFCALSVVNPERPRGIVQLIAVRPGHQRAGIGGLLMTGALKRLRTQAGEAFVRTEAINEPALNLYRSCGFAEWTRFTYYRTLIEPGSSSRLE